MVHPTEEVLLAGFTLLTDLVRCMGSHAPLSAAGAGAANSSPANTLLWCLALSPITVPQVKNRWAELSEEERKQVAEIAFKDVAEGTGGRAEGRV